MSDLWLEGPVTTAAYGWRLERRDGVTLGFTSHDQDVVIDNLLYRASPGMVPSSIVESIGLESNGLDVRGALTADALRVEDIQAGRWDGALLDIFLFDWRNPAAGQRPLATGDFGAISWTDSAFEVEFRGPAARLNRPVAPYASPTCRARFCDADCGLSAGRFRHELVVTSASGNMVSIQPRPGFDPALAAMGELRWLEGPNTGLRQQILAANGNDLMLVNRPAFPISAPTRIELVEGCDKTIATCSTRFVNAINFRGEPYMPGNDLLTRYPGAN